MKAITKTKYGGPEVLQFREVTEPIMKPDQMKVRVKANSANPADWHVMRGTPVLARFAFGLFKPKDLILGADFAGVVEEIGSEVKGFNKGDQVYGEKLQGGAFSEVLCVSPKVCGHMPANAGFATMATVPVAGLTALQALTTHGKIKEGESVLINGASGGVGHFTVQIAKAHGAQVTGVCSNRNIDFVKSLGADEVIAYDKKDIHSHDQKYDLVIDNHGNLNFKDFLRMGHRGVMVGFTTMGLMISTSLQSAMSKFPLTQFTAKANTKDLETLADLIEQEKVKPSIEKTYPAEHIPEAIGYIEAMHTRGKVAMVWD
jgi:NADPH:quinone reductase-like Zn-dependent oxidoreductase